MKKLSLLLVVLFVLVGYDALSAQNVTEGNPAISGLTLESVSKTFESLGLTLKTTGRGWFGYKIIKKGSNNVKIQCSVDLTPENKIGRIVIKTSTLKSAEVNTQFFKEKSFEMLRCVAKLPIKGVDNSKVKEEIETIIKNFKLGTAGEVIKQFTQGGIKYDIRNGEQEIECQATITVAE